MLVYTAVVGEHTRELLAEAGYSTAQIDDLIERRVAIQAVDVKGRIDSAVNA